MDRRELLTLLIQQARKNGFEFGKWYRSHTNRPWTTANDAVDWLIQGSRAQMLVFSHPFARSFFHGGERLRYIQPEITYRRVLPDGSSRSVHRKAHARQSSRDDVWLYHLREMAARQEPLRYLRRFLLMEENLEPGNIDTAANGAERAVPDYDDELIVRA